MPESGFCVHAHFYQPPREDPSTGKIPREAGAAPYPNFNAKITAECYRPNAELGNFARLSYDVGPTLAAWLEVEAPEVHKAIVLSDGGNAMAQAYNHTILPLATRRHKVTQVRWGIADFQHRFGRRPRGMWLPETAVDTETLQVLAEHGIEFTILAPWQAQDPTIDFHVPHRVQLPGGRSVAVFFFDAPLSAEVSFHPDATWEAREFVATRLHPPITTQGGLPPLTMIATDGEFYGHHQPGRDRFLQRLFDEAASAGYEVLHPGLYLDRYGTAGEVAIAEPSAWSCHHGVARWSTGCECTEGESAWKPVVQEALSWLTCELDDAFELGAGELLSDPWAARDDYIRVVLGEESIDGFIAEHAARGLNDVERRKVAVLLEGQLYGQRMHTSCGLFWEDLDRLEMRNSLAYAARAIHCVQAAAGRSLAAEFAQRLRAARSWRSGRTGAEIFPR